MDRRCRYDSRHTADGAFRRHSRRQYKNFRSV